MKGEGLYQTAAGLRMALEERLNLALMSHCFFLASDPQAFFSEPS